MNFSIFAVRWQVRWLDVDIRGIPWWPIDCPPYPHCHLAYESDWAGAAR